MNILVTGASGSLGGYVLRELLEHGHGVADYSRSAPKVKGVEFIQGDIFEPEKLKAACRGREAIIHLAAVPGPGRAAPAELIRINVVGTIHVLESAIEANVGKVVFASSGAATGFSFQKREIVPQYLPVDEEHPCEPQDEYGLSKLLGELTCKRYSDSYGLKTPCLRISHNWYIDWEGAQTAVGSGWAKSFASVEDLWSQRYLKAIEDAEENWPVPGPPPPRNLLWAVTDARDAGQAFRLAVEDDFLLHEVFLISSDDTCSLIQTPELISKYLSKVPLKKPLQGHASLISHDKATRLLGYRPQYSWRDSDFSAWMEQHRSGMG
jgi:nucleoside-diphosphate-sugar epimerase